MTIKKIFDRNFDDEVHSAFLKFGRGEYKDRYLLEAKKQANGWSIKTGPEFANFLVRKCLEKLSGETQFQGIIVSTLDLKNEAEFSLGKSSNFQGVKKIQIDTKTEPEKVLKLINKYPKVFFALSFIGKDFTLKIKAKAPKSGKPGKENEEGPRADFCSLKTENQDLVNELFFETPSFKEISVNHKIIIADIIYPKDFEKLKPTEVREQSKRKGKVIRKTIIDGKEKTSEADFIA